jgi:aquaporin rerated protein, other eukaryote
MNVNTPAANPIVLPFTRVRTIDPANPPARRLPGTKWIPDRTRNHIVAMIGEFVGTFLFLFFAFTGTHVANMWAQNQPAGPHPAALLYIALSFGFSLAVNAWTFFRISGGLFNPAVSTFRGSGETC